MFTSDSLLGQIEKNWDGDLCFCLNWVMQYSESEWPKECKHAILASQPWALLPKWDHDSHPLVVDCSSFVGLIYSHCVSLVQMKPAGHHHSFLIIPQILEPHTPSLVSSNYAHISFFMVFFCWWTVASHHCLPSNGALCNFKKRKCCRYEQRFKNCFSIQLTKYLSCPLLTHQMTGSSTFLPLQGPCFYTEPPLHWSPLQEHSPCWCQSLVLNQRGGHLRFSVQTFAGRASSRHAQPAQGLVKDSAAWILPLGSGTS